jgi:hypothetical protein
MRCFHNKPKPVQQKMGDLPATRFQAVRPFYNCGTDYAGPFLIKPHSLRKCSLVEVYLCIFICFSTKAIHMEVVTSLSAEAYIAALTRFVSRRGLPANIYSDCGSNYVGAASTLNKVMKQFLKQVEVRKMVESFTTQQHINFHFIPPAAPHQGGLWERAVRSIKHHLIRVVGNQTLTLEEFITLTTRIEAILNSRPITPMSNDPSDIDCLTPGHFIVGAPLVSLPEPDWKEVPSNRLSRWQLVQALTQSVWRRWNREYLYTLQQRCKWLKPQANIKTGELVLVHEPDLPPLKWKMGRIVKTFPGKDGLVRTVEILTQTGKLIRPITKVSPLPVND